MKGHKDCQKFKEMIMETRDGEASAETAKKAAEHIASCAECAQYDADLEKMASLASLMKVEAPDYLETRVMAVISGQKVKISRNLAPLFTYAASFALVLFVSVFIIYNRPTSAVKDIAMAPVPAVKHVMTAKAPVEVKYAKQAVKPAVVAASPRTESAPAVRAASVQQIQPAVSAPVVAAAPAPAPGVSYASAAPAITNSQAPKTAAASNQVENGNMISGAAAPVNSIHDADADKITATPTVVMTDIGVVADNLINPNKGQCAKIRVQVAQPETVKIIIYDKAARVVAVLLNESKDTGTWETTWCGQNAAGAVVSQGVYPVYIQAGLSVAKKFIIVTK
jgi:hypothetical protein